MKSILFTLLLILLISGISSQLIYRKIMHNTDPQAKCLDGSPAFIYFHQGTQKDKFMIYMIGGGYCGQTTLSNTLQSCYKRSKTNLGSSNPWPQFIDDRMGLQGLISLNQSSYKNWTKVLVGYCDGSMLQGGNDSPIKYKDTTLYFRGGKIIRSHLKWLIDNHQLDKASKIMLTGGSAGGIAATIWSNYLQSIVKNPSVVYTIPDSGIFVNATTYQTNIPLVPTQIATLMQIAHASEKSPIPQCNAEFPGQEYKCLFIEGNNKYLKGKFMFINSQYDQWAISNMLQIKCLQDGKSGQTPSNCTTDQLSYIQDYRRRYMKFINQTLEPRGWGMWSIACSHHVYQVENDMYNSDAERVPMQSGKTVKQAMEEFILQDKIEWYSDPNPWPSNKPCAY